MRTIDLNADVGESYGRFKLGQDEQLMPYLTSCNIACGFHGGDPLTIQRTIELALENGVRVGAHPSYPDLMGFGRRRIFVPPSELSALLLYQISALKGMVEAQGGRLHHVKPHGALNNHMMEDPEVLHVVLAAVRSFDPELIVYIPYTPDFLSEKHLWAEVFADRTYEDDLRLTPRSIAGSILDDISVAQSHLEQLIVECTIKTRPGTSHPVDYQTVCIHGDNKAAIPIARWIHERSKDVGISIGRT